MIFINVFKIVLGIIFLKSSLTKVKKIYQFYKAIEDYRFIKQKLLIFVVPLLIVIENMLALCLIFPVNPVLFLILGASLQLFYIVLLFFNTGKNFTNNCQCFSLNAPGNVTGKNISVNVLLLISIVLIYGWLINIGIE
ncbi:MauE/DoxX family redox-associated membrane protein [Bacillus cereus]|uniref:Methylamine utilisation protein MauE domain-containing protein n=1 Tax=Bacillus cereus TaxID=1396 RepID=A0AA44Q6H7_BACCE|nr:MauE/DoxX family redox-associated membrane protein [Bacillus cereus]PFN00482.1 hypothetical protein COJ55_25045 [Bacillus cereus]PFR90751.1 hypothetical protein COK38_23300 [Bacillus cereus]